MLKKYLLLPFILLISVLGQKEIRFNYDYSRYKFDEKSIYLEVSYAFSANDLILVEKNGKYSLKAVLRIAVINKKNNDVFMDNNWNIDYPVDDKNNYKEQQILGNLNINIPHGEYNLVVEGKDFYNQSNKKSYNDIIESLSFAKGDFVLSDLQFAQKIKKEDQNTSQLFKKNGYEVIPNPEGIFSESMPVIWYYVEIYANSKLEKPDEREVELLLINNVDKLVEKKTKKINLKDKDIVDVGFFNMKKHPTGSYKMIYKIVDIANNKSSNVQKKFYMYNPNLVVKEEVFVAPKSYLESEFGVLSDSECNNIFDQAKYIATKYEIDDYEKITAVEAKREFLFKFWNSRSDAASPNQFKNDFFNRVKYANQNYGFFNRKGYTTDRGRVYLQYGKPDQIERHPNESDKKPYEIWSYHNIESGVLFIFADMSGFSDYQLVHSTKRGDVDDPDWQQRIIIRIR